MMKDEDERETVLIHHSSFILHSLSLRRGEVMIRVLVVDDHPIVREGLVTVLADQPEIEVVGAAGSAAEAQTLLAQARPEVALLDLELPGASGLDALPLLMAASPELRILVFTAYDGEERVQRALQAG